jgi:hypothetical protein
MHAPKKNSFSASPESGCISRFADLCANLLQSVCVGLLHNPAAPQGLVRACSTPAEMEMQESESEGTKLLAGPSQAGFLDVCQMYIFNPKHHFSTLVLFRAQSRSEPEVIIKRRSVLVVLKRNGTWRNVYCAGFNGWINISDDQSTSGIFVQTNQVSRFEDWRGNNYFYMSGRMMLGCDAKYFLLTQFFYLFFATLVYVYVLPYCPARGVIAVSTIYERHTRPTTVRCLASTPMPALPTVHCLLPLSSKPLHPYIPTPLHPSNPLRTHTHTHHTLRRP